MKLEKVSSYIDAEKQKNGSKNALFYLTDSYVSYIHEDTYIADSIVGTWISCYLIPFLNVPTLGANVLDVLALPVRLPIHLVKEGHAKKDTAKLQRAIFTNDVIEVSNKDFIRLKQYLD